MGGGNDGFETGGATAVGAIGGGSDGFETTVGFMAEKSAKELELETVGCITGWESVVGSIGGANPRPADRPAGAAAGDDRTGFSVDTRAGDVLSESAKLAQLSVDSLLVSTSPVPQSPHMSSEASGRETIGFMPRDMPPPVELCCLRTGSEGEVVKEEGGASAGGITGSEGETLEAGFAAGVGADEPVVCGDVELPAIILEACPTTVLASCGDKDVSLGTHLPTMEDPSESSPNRTYPQQPSQPNQSSQIHQQPLVVQRDLLLEHRYRSEGQLVAQE